MAHIWRFATAIVLTLVFAPQISLAASSSDVSAVQKITTSPQQFAQLVFCVPPEVWSKKRKRCVNPFVKKRVRCKAPRIWSKKQRRCVFPVVEDSRCAAKEIWSQNVKACVCREGYERGENGCQVVVNEPIGPDYAEIQRCLNQLGFNAGAVDGQPGQRTRRAWNQFRAEVGLGRRAAPLTDKKTQKRLFEECEADRKQGTKVKGEAEENNQAEERVEEPKDQTSAEQEPATQKNSEGGAGYSDVMCVSKGLKKTLSRLLGKRKSLAICGEACVPIPPGMTAAQLKQSEEEYSVNWCRNCIRIGKAGIVCGNNP